MKLSEVRINIDPRTGAHTIAEGPPVKPYITLERRLIEPGETYEEMSAAGVATGKRSTYPANQTHLVEAVIHNVDGSETKYPHRNSPEGPPGDVGPAFECEVSPHPAPGPEYEDG